MYLLEALVCKGKGLEEFLLEKLFKEKLLDKLVYYLVEKESDYMPEKLIITYFKIMNNII
jgi:hypothetical protein